MYIWTRVYRQFRIIFIFFLIVYIYIHIKPSLQSHLHIYKSNPKQKPKNHDFCSLIVLQFINSMIFALCFGWWCWWIQNDFMIPKTCWFQKYITHISVHIYVCVCQNRASIYIYVCVCVCVHCASIYVCQSWYIYIKKKKKKIGGVDAEIKRRCWWWRN